MRLLIIYNPIAGRRRRRRLAAVLVELRQRGIEPVLKETTRRGDAEAFARGAEADGIARVVVAGGDGTINEAINGLAGGTVPLAIVPLGTANVLAAEIGLGGCPREIADTILEGTPRPIALGRVATASGARRFALMVGIGFDAQVVARVDPAFKRLTGKLAYVVASAGEFIRRPGFPFDIEIDGRMHRAASAIIAKGRFYGGRFVVCPDARLEDASLQVCLFGRPGRWHVVRYAAALAMGRLAALPDVTIVTARRVAIDGPAGEPLQVDGDSDGCLPATVDVDSSLRLLFP